MNTHASEKSKKTEYKNRAEASIEKLVSGMECQPIFFIGSGISRRYFEAPNWLELLKLTALQVGISQESFAYISQKYDQNCPKIGSALAEKAFEWAWKDGKTQFSAEFFSDQTPKENFLKKLVCDVIAGATPNFSALGSSPYLEEINALRNCRPHAIITTNYDNFLESVFEGYEAIVGQKIIRSDLNMIGEILKIHGSVEDYASIVVTEEDYENYNKKRKYLSAKLLTYLAEHPVFVIGYRLGDSNVIEIMKDLAEIIGEENKLIPNIIYVKWAQEPIAESELQEEFSFDGFRVKTIVTDDLRWVFEKIRNNKEMNPINIKLLRALASRTYKLIRKDVPSMDIEFDFTKLEEIAGSDECLPRILGISSSRNPNADYPFLMQDLAFHLKFGKDKRGTSKVQKLMKTVIQSTGVNIKDSDNKYQYAVKSGSKSVVRRYSKLMLEILKKAKAGEEVSIIL